MTAIPNLTLLPAPPQRGQEASVFAQKADAFVDALVLLIPELNQFAQALRDEFYNLSVVKFTATSTSAVAIGMGAKAFVATIGVAFSPGQVVMVASAADPTKYMQGAITSYDPVTGALAVNVTAVGGAVTRSDWKIGLVPAFDIEQRLAPIVDRLALLAAPSNWPEASATEARAAAASRLISAAALWAMYAPVALTDAATVAIDLSAGVNFSLVLGGNRVLAAPTNLKPGQRGFIRVSMDAAGRTLSYNASWKFLDGATAPSLNDNGITLLEYTVSAAGEFFIGGGKPSGGSIAASHPGYVSGRFYPTMRAMTQTSGAASSGRIYAIPIVITAPMTIASVRVPSTDTAQAFRVGIYASASGRPGVPLGETTGTSSTSAAVNPTLNIQITQPSVYWIAIRFGAQVNLAVYAAAESLLAPLIGDTGAAITSGVTAYYADAGAAGLPNPFPATTTITSAPLTGFTAA